MPTWLFNPHKRRQANGAGDNCLQRFASAIDRCRLNNNPNNAIFLNWTTSLKSEPATRKQVNCPRKNIVQVLPGTADPLRWLSIFRRSSVRPCLRMFL